MKNLLTNPKLWKSFFTPDRYSYDHIPSLTGKVAIVTGANSGIGFVTTVAMAARGAHVILACRSKERAMAAIERAKIEIKEEFPLVKPKLEFLELDLNDLNKTYRSAQEFLAKGLPLHILTCNSGIMNTPFALTVDGVEQQFGVNHLGHFVFTLALLDRLKASQPSRVVVLSSILHEVSVKGGIDFDTLNDPKASTNWTRYGRSKLANLFFGQELARRLANEKVYVNIVHPGYIATGLNRHAEESMGAVSGRLSNMAECMFAIKPSQGALTQLYVATSPEIERENIRGKYFMPIANEIRPNPISKNLEIQTRLWEVSEQLMREKVKM
ncbi:Short-chain dehydrogenase/reductase 2b [Linnemannia zychae]|nr:Short-chain dehydrogenase/reductase 2b [Linnemannia zychae]